MSEPRRATLTRVVLFACDALQAASRDLCELDSVAGDGDHGLSMASAAAAVQSKLLDAEPVDAHAVAELVAAEFAAVGGSIGALTYVLMRAVGATITDTDEPLSASSLAQMLAVAEEAVGSFGGAQPGDKTMLDALFAARRAADQCAQRDAPAIEAMLEIAAGAREGALATAEMVARVGRASRLGDRSLGSVDPGASSVAIVLSAIATAYAEWQRMEAVTGS